MINFHLSLINEPLIETELVAGKVEFIDQF